MLTQQAHVFVVLVLDELDDDLLLWLQLQQLEHQAHEVSGLPLSAVGAPHVGQGHRLVHQGLGRQPEAVLLPVHGLPYLGAQDLLNQILQCRGSGPKRLVRLSREGENAGLANQVAAVTKVCL